jgi:hypothetical protein
MELLKYINNLNNISKPRTVIKIKRGVINNLPNRLEPNEIFYVTDAHILGVADSTGNPNLLVAVEELPYIEDFPVYPDRNKLYYSILNEQVYYYDYQTQRYEPVRLNTFNLDIR